MRSKNISKLPLGRWPPYFISFRRRENEIGQDISYWISYWTSMRFFDSQHLHNFPFRPFEWFRAEKSRVFQLSHWILNIFCLSRSGGYYTEFCFKENQGVDGPDFAKISQGNIDRLAFDENNQKWPPFSLNLFCVNKLKIDRSLLLIHHLVNLIL